MGGDDANVVSVLPAMTAGAGDRASEESTEHRPAEAPSEARRAARTGDHDRSADDTDVGWGERTPGSNDDRLITDKPPHW